MVERISYRRLEDVLGSGQEYVSSVAGELGIDVRAVWHEAMTDTCFEKAEILGWDSRRVVKAVFLHKDREMYGFVFPELGAEKPLSVSAKDVLPSLLGISGKQAKKYRNSVCPEGMEFGTCTPFVPEDAFNQGLSRLYIHNFSDIEDQVVDISIGGSGEGAHKTSLHLPYEGIYDILERRFGDRVQKAELFTNI